MREQKLQMLNNLVINNPRMTVSDEVTEDDVHRYTENAQSDSPF